MPVKKYKPVTPSQRFRTGYTFDEITTDKPEKSLLKPKSKSGGRNNRGRITCRHRGGGHRRHYRIIDFKRNKFDIPAKVATIEYDPNRTARITALSTTILPPKKSPVMPTRISKMILIIENCLMFGNSSISILGIPNV